MSNFPPFDGKNPRRRPSLAGVLMQDVTQGKERVRSWPRSRGKPKTAAAKRRQDAFAEAQFFSKYIEPNMMALINNWTDGTPLLPRDIVTAMLFNRLFIFELETGEVLYTMAFRKDVEESLNALDAQVGDVLVKTENGWEGMPYGGGAGAGLLMGSAVTTIAQSIGSSGYTKVAFNTLEVDGGIPFDSAQRGFVPDVAGWYLALASVQSTTAAVRNLRIGRNDVEFYHMGPDTNQANWNASGSQIIYCDGVDDCAQIFARSFVGSMTVSNVNSVTRFTLIGPILPAI